MGSWRPRSCEVPPPPARLWTLHQLFVHGGTMSVVTQGTPCNVVIPRGATSVPPLVSPQPFNPHMEIKGNDEVDRLVKMATGLPLRDYTPAHTGDIAVKGGPAATPAKKWVIERRHHDSFLAIKVVC